jgi:riboflavin kinase / FMN adenylyltransferase
LHFVRVYQSIEGFRRLENAVVTIGTFDGVHAGHQKIISHLKQIAAETGGETVLLTFYPHPRAVLQPDDNDLKLITTMEERITLLEKAGIDHLIIQPFDKEFSRISAVEFVRDLLIAKIGMKTLVIGYDHHFGRNREGSYKDLEEMSPVYNFRLEEIPEQIIDDMTVSSTKIRKALLSGDIETANHLLIHPFSFHGKVIHGDKIGRTIGFPTANIRIHDKSKLIPANGIYAATVDIDGKKFNGMLYIGNRPVLGTTALSVEINIFDFDRDIYDKDLIVSVIGRIPRR